jgi:hypothetical protein
MEAMRRPGTRASGAGETTAAPAPAARRGSVLAARRPLTALGALAGLAGLAAACHAPPGADAAPGGDGGATGFDAAGGSDAADDAGQAPVDAASLLAATAACTPYPGSGLYATDSGEADTVPVCALSGAVWWRADMDVDCDGGTAAACMADPWYLPETSATTSTGAYLDASNLPFMVVPLASARFDYVAADIHLGAVAAVIYGSQLVWAVFGDEGPSGIIGEGSYALAQALGIDPDPVTGGADSGVTFIVFTGTAAVADPIESPAAAAALGEMLARTLL